MISKENVDKVMELAPEKNIKKKKSCNKKALNRYCTWIIGMVVSFVPLLALPFTKALTGIEQDFFKEMFMSNEIFFIGVSLSIAALNDYINKTNKNSTSDVWVYINIITIAIGAMFYGITTVLMENITKNNTVIDNDFLCFCNVVYLLVIIMLSSYKYIREICGVK